MSSKWTHLICYECWQEQRGTAIPFRMKETNPDPCCYCRRQTRSGIYTRDDPTLTRCGGEKGIHLKENNNS